MIKRLKRDTGQFVFCQTGYQRLMSLLAHRRFQPPLFAMHRDSRQILTQFSSKLNCNFTITILRP